ncbi:MAG: hypothetical protein P6D49_04170 [Acidimicrobiales bacterium]|nr:hypothetical protein [Acidimicrobiales bacterium]
MKILYSPPPVGSRAEGGTTATPVLAELRAVLPAPNDQPQFGNPQPNNEYIRLTHLPTGSRAFADFREEYYVFMGANAEDEDELDRPELTVPDWQQQLISLGDLT